MRVSIRRQVDVLLLQRIFIAPRQVMTDELTEVVEVVAGMRLNAFRLPFRKYVKDFIDMNALTAKHLTRCIPLSCNAVEVRSSQPPMIAPFEPISEYVDGGRWYSSLLIRNTNA